MRETRESYSRIGDEDDRFDIEFWQSQGDEAIFSAALDMVLDYLSVTSGRAEEPRLQRTVEYYGRSEVRLTRSHRGTKK
jgi:hypothetical protein